MLLCYQAVTVTAHVSVNVPQVAVIVADPAATPVTSPVALTLAVASAEELHVISPVAPAGNSVAES